MAHVDVNLPAPDFTLPDFRGNSFSLSQHKGEKRILLVLNRGFV